MKLKMIVLSGAGISAESGIATFRDSDGLWEQYRIEDVATPEAWKKDPELVQRFYNERRKQVIACEPNAAHRFFADCEKLFDVTIITQNIDDLHQRGGSNDILHLHGEIRKSKSSGPKQEQTYYEINGWELSMEDRCSDGYVLRPHVVWFGEAVPNLERAVLKVAEADILVVVGTSLNVYPAANLIHYAPDHCRKFVLDPKADELEVPGSFTKISATAVEGVKMLEEFLNEK
ncbi:MAG: NAD-dependent deacylase [Flavobacteriia bacterium]|nr:NAD-dependent deacylase [Flavobacteriia bacterium]